MISGCIFSAKVFLHGTSRFSWCNVPLPQSVLSGFLWLSPSIRMQKMSQLSRVAKVPPLQHLEEGGTWLDVGENVNLLL